MESLISSSFHLAANRQRNKLDCVATEKRSIVLSVYSTGLCGTSGPSRSLHTYWPREVKRADPLHFYSYAAYYFRCLEHHSPWKRILLSRLRDFRPWGPSSCHAAPAP